MGIATTPGGTAETQSRSGRRRQARWGSGKGKACWVALVVAIAACNAHEEVLPPNVQDPATLQTPSGAFARYRGALAALPLAFDWYLGKTATLTDELSGLPIPFGAEGDYTGIDARDGLEGFEEDYNRLHKLRGQAREARGFLEAFAGDSTRAMTGHLTLIEAYAEILLADLFCSGIPLSTVDYDGDYTLQPGSTTRQVYQHAIALADSASLVVSDSVRFQHLAAMARGRALLALGEYADAGQAVINVPDDYAYQMKFDPPIVESRPQRFVLIVANRRTAVPGSPSVGDQEGGNGLRFRSSGDPRIAITPVGNDLRGQMLYLPTKYLGASLVTLTLATGIEARLIEAEAAWHAGGDWLGMLNALRTDGTFQENAGDTVWHAGRGGVADLAPLEDPGDAGLQVDLLFRERAFWLYMTGHRQGDLRRLIREYGRLAGTIYPRGPYSLGSGRLYGDRVVAPVPEGERRLNPKYTGCIDHDA